jgi:hypothetical protein
LHKTAVAKAKKAESALSDATKERLQWEQVIAEWLNKISAAAGGTYLSCTLFPADDSFFFYFIDNAFSFLLTFLFLSIQSVPRLLCQLRNLLMILFWPRSTCSRQTGYPSRMFSSWLAAFYRGCLSDYGRIEDWRFQSMTWGNSPRPSILGMTLFSHWRVYLWSEVLKAPLHFPMCMGRILTGRRLALLMVVSDQSWSLSLRRQRNWRLP